MANIKFKAIYTGECSRQADLIGRGYSFFLAIASASSIAAWSIWKTIPGLWACLVGFGQLLHLAKPYLPLIKSDKDFLEMSFAFESLYLEYERFWVAYDEDRMPEDDVDARFYALREKEIAIEKMHKHAQCPRFQKLIAKAEQEAKTCLALNFSQ